MDAQSASLLELLVPLHVIRVGVLLRSTFLQRRKIICDILAANDDRSAFHLSEYVKILYI